MATRAHGKPLFLQLFQSGYGPNADPWLRFQAPASMNPISAWTSPAATPHHLPATYVPGFAIVIVTDFATIIILPI